MTAVAPPADESGRRIDRLPDRLPAPLAVAVLAAALAYATGPIGLAVAVATGGAWALAPAPYALAAGHVALVALVPGGVDPLSAAVVEGGFLAVLAAALLRDPAPRPALAAAGLALLATGAVAWAALAALPLWGVAGAILLALGTVGYAIHRYQLVRFDLLDAGASAGTTDRATPASDADTSEDEPADRTPPGATGAETDA